MDPRKFIVKNIDTIPSILVSFTALFQSYPPYDIYLVFVFYDDQPF